MLCWVFYSQESNHLLGRQRQMLDIPSPELLRGQQTQKRENSAPGAFLTGPPGLGQGTQKRTQPGVGTSDCRLSATSAASFCRRYATILSGLMSGLAAMTRGRDGFAFTEHTMFCKAHFLICAVFHTTLGLHHHVIRLLEEDGHPENPEKGRSREPSAGAAMA